MYLKLEFADILLHVKCKRVCVVTGRCVLYHVTTCEICNIASRRITSHMHLLSHVIGRWKIWHYLYTSVKKWKYNFQFMIRNILCSIVRQVMIETLDMSQSNRTQYLIKYEWKKDFVQVMIWQRELSTSTLKARYAASFRSLAKQIYRCIKSALY